jgi:putative flippase GtrA
MCNANHKSCIAGGEPLYDPLRMTKVLESQSRMSRLIYQLKEQYGQKSLRYLAVSAFNVILGQCMLIVFNKLFGFGFELSNVAAVIIGSVPAYFLSRYWVWKKTGKNHLLKEVVPFWSLALAGLVASTLLVGVAEGYSDSVLVLMGSNFVAFGGVWVAKFFILEKILFKNEELSDEPLDALVDQVLHHEDRPRD